MRRIGRLIPYLTLAAMLLACLLGRGHRRATVESRPTMATLSEPQPAVPPPPGPMTPVAPPGSRLPTVLAGASFAPAGGDAYRVRDLAFDEAGRAFVLCDDAGDSTNAALVVVDPKRGTRGPALLLPFTDPCSIAASHGRVYISYNLSHRQNLAAIDPNTGRMLATAKAESSGCATSPDGLLTDPAGLVYLPLYDRLEVRDGTTLAVVRSLPWPADAFGSDSAIGKVNVEMDPTGQRLYLATPVRLHAYRTTDLSPLWDAPYLSGRLLVDAAGRYVYAWHNSLKDCACEVHLTCYEADSGKALTELCFSTNPEAQGPHLPPGGDWTLLYANSQQGYLVFCGHDRGQSLLWKTQLDGQPAQQQAVPAPRYGDVFDVYEERLFLYPWGGYLAILDLASLQPQGWVTLGVGIVDVLADPDRGRLYVSDTAGRLHVLDARDCHTIASLPAGSGPMTLDAPNGLLFVAHRPGAAYVADDVAVVDTGTLTVTAVITGGDRVAVDSAGRRAFVGTHRWAAPPVDVQVWDTRTFQRLGAIPQAIEPVYNPLRDEIYVLPEPGAILPPVFTVVDGKSLKPASELQLDPQAGIVVDARQEVIVSGSQVLSARTLEPLTHAVTLLHQPDGSGMAVVPPEEGRVYTFECSGNFRERGTVQVTAWRAGTDEMIDRGEGLCLSLYLPGGGIGLVRDQLGWQAYDLRTWEPLGSFPDTGISRLDPATRRLYAWRGSTLAVLGWGD